MSDLRRHRRRRRWGMVPLVLVALTAVPSVLAAQMLFGPGSVNGTPIQPGNLLTSGQTATYYYDGHTGVSTLDPGQSVYDAMVWAKKSDPIPPNWEEGIGGWGRKCLPGSGDAGELQIRTPLPLGPTTVTTWGTYCFAFDVQTITRFHRAGQPNGPIFPDPPPDEAATPECPDGKCGDPVSMMTGSIVRKTPISRCPMSCPSV